MMPERSTQKGTKKGREKGKAKASHSFPGEARRVEVIAHRGLSARAPENTLSAIRAAIEGGADRVEFDVLISRDGVPVVIHDADLDRTTDGKGPVAALNIEQLRRLDAGRWFHPRFAGERVPTLDEALDLCRGRISVNVEVKGEAVRPGARNEPKGVEARIVEAVRRRAMEAVTVVSSFEPLALERFRVLAPEIVRQSLYEPARHRGLGPADVCRAVAARAFNCSKDEVNAAWIDEAHRAGLKINVYTVDEPQEFEDLIRQGVDGIFTNRADGMLELLGRRSETQASR